MNDAEALTRKLFENQTLFVPPTDDAAYKLKAELQKIEAQVVVISLFENEKDKADQSEIFKRMLSRLPDPNVSAQVVYADQNQIELSSLSALAQTKHVLLCGVELKNHDTVMPLNKTVTRDQMQILPVEAIAFIDLDPKLKKAMWSEWMKQFGK